MNSNKRIDSLDDERNMLRRKENQLEMQGRGFPGGSVIKNLPANVGDTGPIPDLGRSHMPQRN